MNTTTPLQIAGLVLDLAGTTVDYGSCAPANVFQQVFTVRDIPVTAEQAREPMGMAKRDHIASILAMPAVQAAWQEKCGSASTDADIDQIYAEFLPLQRQVIGDHADVIPGVAAAIDQCRAQGLRIGATTGYTRELLAIVVENAARQGYQPEFALGAEDARQGRPAPYLLFEAAQRFGIYPMAKIVKVDDTPVGIRAGRSAGCWTIGVTRTGNCVGLSMDAWDALPAAAQRQKIDAADAKLFAAGAHATIESVADILPVLEQFNARLAAGELPRVM